MASFVDSEIQAIMLTNGNDNGRQNRRLTDFIFHNFDGKPRPVEMLEVDDLLISGRILPLEEGCDKEKNRGVRCNGFGRIESWAISGYEEGSLVIWVSTDITDYECLSPAGSYNRLYNHFYEKARACVEVYKQVSKRSEGKSILSLDELLAGVVRSMSLSKCFSTVASLKDFLISSGEFICEQLISLDESSKEHEVKFAESSVLAALRDESRTHIINGQVKRCSSNILGQNIIDGETSVSNEVSKPSMENEIDSLKLARLLQEEQYWQGMKRKRGKVSSSLSSTYYIQISEGEIANDYPFPVHYKLSVEEADELVVFDNALNGFNYKIPYNILLNWSIYDSDSRFISLELLPMNTCADIDVPAFGSGVMLACDGSEFSVDDGKSSSQGGPNEVNEEGIPIFLSGIKEWTIELGSSMVFISIRTDLSWYRLGKPSKQYAPWYEPVLKTAKLALSIITLLKEQPRVSRLSFPDIIKKVSGYNNYHPAYISSNFEDVERYVVVHGQIILQQFIKNSDERIRKCAFVSGLLHKIHNRGHSKWMVKKKNKLLQNEISLNPRDLLAPVSLKRSTVKATTTKFINRIWKEYYSNFSLEDAYNRQEKRKVKEDKEVTAKDANGNKLPLCCLTDEPFTVLKMSTICSSKHKIKWTGEVIGKTCSGEDLYRQAVVDGKAIDVGSAVLMKNDEETIIYFVEYLFETKDGKRLFHGRKMLFGSQTILGNIGNEREVFLTTNCLDSEIRKIKQTFTVEIRNMSWGHRHRKDNLDADEVDRAKAAERKRKRLPVEYFCKSLYEPEKGAFLRLPCDTMGIGSGFCYSCDVKQSQKEKEAFRLKSCKTSFEYNKTKYNVLDFVYVSYDQFAVTWVERGTLMSSRNVGLKAFVVCQILEIVAPTYPVEADCMSTHVKVRRFFRPEDISADMAYSSDIREVFYSEEKHSIAVDTIEGICKVRRKFDIPPLDSLAILDHIFFCELFYDPFNGSLKQLPDSIELKYSTGNLMDEFKDQACKPLATLDIFAGCGGLSAGLQKAGASITKWAIEYEEPAGEAFKLNHPESSIFIDDCNVILRAVMKKCGDADDCVSTLEAAQLSESLEEKNIQNLPLPGDVDFITGGPPCQGFSGLNRYSQSTWSKAQSEMILVFLSFADYFRPKFFLLENVRTFISFNKGQMFRLTLASLLAMGYQVRFGILEAGNFGVSQSRKRAFIWAASPEEILPEWPEPMHVFSARGLKISLSEEEQYVSVRNTEMGAPFRAITVRDTIGDLPAVGNGASKKILEYENGPVSWFQKNIRQSSKVLTDHISKEMNELNFIRCKKIPKQPGADWRDLMEEKVKLSNGQLVDLIPWFLPNTAKRHNQWKGLLGRLDWEGNFPVSVTDPQPMGIVGMCFHPDQDRILSVRECARSQGFPDSYKYFGNVHHKHRQIGNAVPPPLAYVLGTKLKEAIAQKKP
ncbi:unnamed protein product [Rhodiola kirilowii]